MANQSEPLAQDRVRWHDEESATKPLSHRQPIRRKDSGDSLAIRSQRGSRHVEPGVALPIQYRSVSFQIEDSKGKDQIELAKAKRSTAKDLTELEWHTYSVRDVEQRLNTSISHGLSEDQAARRLVQYGRNAPSPPKTNWPATILGYFFKGFGGILLVGAILVFVSWKPLGDPPAIANLVLGIVLLAVFFLQAAFTMFQDWSSSRVMSSIKDLLPEDCHVLRDNRVTMKPAVELVPGDVVFIKAGNKVPADLRFIEVSSDSKFDRSLLTGESIPVDASVDCTDRNYLETINLGLQGSHCVIGSCTGIVVATSDKTVFGRIAALTNEPKVKLTTMEREILYFVGFITAIMLTMIVLIVVLWAAWLRREHPNFINVPTLIVDAVSVAIAFIPEGLPIAVSAGLTITAKLMKKHDILCKSLKTVETLGTVSVICSDKTGTLTQGNMAVSDVSIGAESMSLETIKSTSDKREGDKQLDRGATTNALKQAAAIGALCNAAEFDAADADSPAKCRKMFGDATDQAILGFAENVESGSVSFLRSCWTRVFELPFNSKNKFMVRCFTSHRQDAVSQTLGQAMHLSAILLTIKGAPDILIENCSHYMEASGSLRPLDGNIREKFERLKAAYSSEGKRCLLLARKVISEEQFNGSGGSSPREREILAIAKEGLTLVGLLAIRDPLRPEIPDVCKTLRGAGIRIAMVTGDFALTALAIAREAGIVTSERVDSVADLNRSLGDGKHDDNCVDASRYHGTVVISGPELLTLSDEQWSTIVDYKEIIFARTTPDQKLRIVKEFQKNSVVAMTGDGVNDAPSLKAADVGIAMSSGSDIAMEAADMVLLNSFSSIVIAVQYGRVVFDNLKKVIVYLLPAGSFSEFWPVLTSVAFGLPQILSSFLMIIICCFTDCGAATMLAFEKPERDVLLRPPRDVKRDRLVNWQLIAFAYGLIGILETLSSFAMAFWYLETKGIAFGDIWFSFGVVPSHIDPDYYSRHLNIASSIYFVNLVVMQWFNLLATRTRRLSIFQHPPLFNGATQNLHLFPAIIFSLLIAIFWLYPGVFQEVLDTAPVPVEHWFLPFAFGTGIIIIDEVRKYLVREYPKSLLAKASW